MNLELDIRPLHTFDEYQAAQQIIELTWGTGRDDAAPPIPTLIATRLAGGLVCGAFHQGEMVGCSYAFPGWMERRVLLYSQMTAVHPRWRDRGVGLAVKRYQRRWALEQGYGRIRWTFDPLMAANARFNFHYLGAAGIAYLVDFYGASTSLLHGGMPTDRFLCEWELSDPRVESLAAGEPPAEHLEQGEAGWLYQVEPTDQGVLMPRDPDAVPTPSHTGLLAPIPADYLDLCRRQPELARRWRLYTRQAFQSALAEGWRFEDLVGAPPSSPAPNCPHYLLRRHEHETVE